MGDIDPSLLSLSTRRQMQETESFLRGLTPEVLGMRKPAETGKPQQAPGLPTAVAYGLMRGTYGLGAELGGVLGTVGTTLGSDTIAEWGNTAADYWSKAAEALPRRDPRRLTDDWKVLISPGWWAENVAEALPGFAAFLAPSMTAPRVAMVAGKYMNLSNNMIGKLAWIGQKTAGPAMFSAQEMGSVYNEVRSRGGSESDAAKVATEAMFVAAGLGAINLHYLLGEGGSFLGRAGRGAVSNTIISFLASGSRGAMLGDDVLQVLKEAVDQAPVQAALGAAGGAAGWMQSRPDKAAKPATTETPPKGQEVPESAKLAEMRRIWQEEREKGTLSAPEIIQAKADADAAAEAARTRPTEPSRTEQETLRQKEMWERSEREFALRKSEAFQLGRDYMLQYERKNVGLEKVRRIERRVMDVLLEHPEWANDPTPTGWGAMLAELNKERITEAAPIGGQPTEAVPERAPMPGERTGIPTEQRTLPMGSDSVLDAKGKLTIGENDQAQLAHMEEVVKLAEQSPAYRAPVVDPVTGEMQGWGGQRTVKDEWMRPSEGEPGYGPGEYYKPQDMRAVLDYIRAGKVPPAHEKLRVRIFDKIMQQLKGGVGEEVLGKGANEVLPAERPMTEEERRTQFFAEYEKLSQEERASENVPELASVYKSGDSVVLEFKGGSKVSPEEVKSFIGEQNVEVAERQPSALRPGGAQIFEVTFWTPDGRLESTRAATVIERLKSAGLETGFKGLGMGQQLRVEKEVAPTPTETAPESPIVPEAAREAPPIELTDWQRRMKEAAETGNVLPEPTINIAELWPGMKPVQVSESVRPFFEGLQKDAINEAGRLRQARGVFGDDAAKARMNQMIASGEFTVETLLNAKAGEAWPVEKLLAGRAVLQSMVNRTKLLADMSMQESSGVSIDQAHQALELTIKAGQAYSAAYSEAGRALRSGRTDIVVESAGQEVLRDPIFQWGGNLPPDHPFYRQAGPDVSIDQLLATAGSLGKGVDKRYLMQQIAAMKSPQKAQELMGLWARLGRAGMELFYGSILSPISVARNAIAFPATLAYYMGTVAAAEAGRRFAKWIAPDRVSEARGIIEGSSGAAWTGLHQGLKDAFEILGASWEASREVMRKEGIKRGLMELDQRIRDEAQNLGPLSFESLRRKPDMAGENFPELGSTMGGLVDTLGLMARLPTMTGLTAGDILSKIVNDRIGITMKAHEMAKAQGYEVGSAEFTNEVARLIKDRPPEIDRAGVDLANKNTFTGNEGIIGWATQTLSHPLLRLLVSPFTRTPLRIMEYAMEGTPVLQNLTLGWWQDVRSGDVARRDLAFAKMGIGWGMFAVVGGLAANGFVTGTGPQDPREAEAKRRTGWQPLSVHVPGIGYVSYAGMEPLSTWIGMAADFINRAAELPQVNAESLLYTLTIAAGDNMFTKRYVQGFSDWIAAIKGPSVNERMEALRNRLALPVPLQGTLGVLRRGYTDPTVKDARTLLDRYLSFLPGGSEFVPPRRNIINGEPIRYEGAWGPDFISPFFHSTEQADRVFDEIDRLRGAGLRRVPDTIGGPEEGALTVREPLRPFGVPLSPQQQERWTLNMTQEVKFGGKTLYQRLHDVIASETYGRQSELGKVNALRAIYDEYKEAGKQRLLREDPQLSFRVAELQRERMYLRMPQRQGARP